MTIWTMDQVRKARGIFARVEIDEAYGELPREELVREFHKNMQRIAETFAIELDPRDIRMEQTDSTPSQMRLTITAWWEPETHEVEVMGGHEDGRTYEFRGAPHEPLMVMPPRTSVGPYDTTICPGDLSSPTRLECVGWREKERHWVYGVTE